MTKLTLRDLADNAWCNGAGDKDVIIAIAEATEKRLAALESSHRTMEDFFIKEISKLDAKIAKISVEISTVVFFDESVAYQLKEAAHTHTPSPVGDKTSPTETKEWNPATDVFWAWLCNPFFHKEQCIQNMGEQVRSHFISIGNCFQTREEAEDEGKWLFQDRLVLDANLRKAGCFGAVKMLSWSFERNKIVYHAPFPTEAMEQAEAILGEHAKRYLTGEK